MIRNRRYFSRYAVDSHLPVCMGAPSGTLHDLGEGGLAVDAVYGSDNQVTSVSLEFGDQQIEANALIVWKDHSKNRMGLKFVDLSETTRQQVKKLLSLGLIEDNCGAGIAAKQGPEEPQLTKPLFTLSSLATSEEALPPREVLHIEETDEDFGSLADVPTRQWSQVAGGICLGSLLLVLLVALFLFPETMLSLWSDLTSTDIDRYSSPAAAPPSSSASPAASAPSVATIPAASGHPPTAPAMSHHADATLIERIEVFRTNEQTNVQVRGNGLLSCRTSRLSNPERLVLDFYGARMGSLPASLPAHSKPVQGIRMSQFKPDVARVVVDLEGVVPYRTRSDDNSLTVAFAPSGIVQPSALVPHSKAVMSPFSAGAARKIRPNGGS